MITATWHDEQGQLGSWYSLPDANADDLPANCPHGWLEGHHDPDTVYALDGQPTPRPATGLPEAHSLPVGTDWPVPDVPAGTAVLIDGAEAGTVDGDGLVLAFPEPGVWRVELRPPFPWRDAVCEVTAHAD